MFLSVVFEPQAGPLCGSTIRILSDSTRNIISIVSPFTLVEYRQPVIRRQAAIPCASRFSPFVLRLSTPESPVCIKTLHITYLIILVLAFESRAPVSYS